MPAIDNNFILLIKKNLNVIITYPNFIETGTWKGDTIFGLEPYFNKLYTIEIKKELYENVKNKYNGNKINFILGDSSAELINICKLLDGNSIFFLDGHWSAGDTGKGEKDCPLYEELRGILINCKYENIIIIDDVRLFGKGPNIGNELCNWEDINSNTILNIVKERLLNYFYLDSEISKNDRLILHLKNI